MALTQDEIQMIARAVIAALDERRGMGEEAHRNDHLFIAELKIQKEIRRKRVEGLRQQIVGWGAITALWGIISAIGYAAYQWVRVMKG